MNERETTLSVTELINDAALHAHLAVTPGPRALQPILYQSVPQLVQYLAGRRAAAALTLTGWGQPWAHFADSLPLALSFFLLRPELPEVARQRWRDFIEYFVEHCADLFGARVHIASLRTPQKEGFFERPPAGRSHQECQTTDGRPAYIYVRENGVRGSSGVSEILFDLVVFGEAAPTLPPRVTVAAPPVVLDVPDDRALIREILRLYDERGPAAYALMSADTAQTLAEGTILSPDALRWLWAGLPHMTEQKQDLLGKELRQKLGLKAKPLTEARAQFNLRSADDHYRFFAQIMRVADPEDLWREAGFKTLRAALLDHWAPTCADPPADLVALCQENLQLKTDLLALLRVLVGLDDQRFSALELRETGEQAIEGRTILRLAVWGDLAQLIFFLPNVLPVGHPILRQLVRLCERLLAFVQPDFLVTLPGQTIFDEARRAHAFNQVPGAECTVQRGDRTLRLRGDETFCVLLEGTTLRPYIALSAWSQKARRAHILEAHYGVGWSVDTAPQIGGARFFFDEHPQVQTILARLRETPAAVGRYEGDPRASVPDLVAQVQAKYGLSEASAALYLLTLAHPDPKKSEITKLLGWKSPQYEAAAEPLVAAELLVKAKRTGAGREYFLPGPWEKAERIEAWKLLFYRAEEIQNVRIAWPWHVAFERAWARIALGKIPRFQAAQRS